MTKPRINAVGIQYLPKAIHSTLFPKPQPTVPLTKLSQQYLAQHKLLNKPTSLQPEVNIKLPPLVGSSMDAHFRRIARFSEEPYKEQALQLSNASIPKMPSSFLRKSGWVRYIEGEKPQSVPFPTESSFVFDVEVLYKVSPYPVMATAVSEKAWYAWVSPILTEESESFKHLVPLNTLQEDRVIIGHNVGYDRARVQEEYNLKETRGFYLDTMAMHVAVSGMCSRQRGKWMERRKAMNPKKTAKKSEEDLGENDDTIEGEEVDPEKVVRQLEIDDPWLNHSAPNSLAELSSFYFGEDIAKSARDFFASDTLQPIKENFQDLMKYCATDVLTTHKVYAHILPQFLETCPHPVSFAALKYMGSGILPTTSEWHKYIDSAEQKYVESRTVVDIKLEQLARECADLRHNLAAVECDPWLKQLNWTITPVKITKSGEPYKNQKLPGFPQWYKDAWSSKKEKLEVSLRGRLVPLLLKLKFEGGVVVWNDDKGWCFTAKRADHPKFLALNYELVKPLTFPDHPELHDAPVDEASLPETLYFKIPNPAAPESRTTQLLSKSMNRFFETGCLAAEGEVAREVLSLNEQGGYWVSARERIKSQFVVDVAGANPTASETDSSSSELAPRGTSIIIPQVITMGTITRRAVEKTWLTASNAKKNRIGSELKSKIRAPETHCFVGADVDSEELWIASLLGDSILGLHGGTAIGWMTLEGAKKDGTDLHSKTADILGISRDQAKIFNYGRIYGAGVKFAASLLRQFNGELTEAECLDRAKVLYAETKGQTVVVTRDGERHKVWFGGSESVLFNELERIANLDNPRTPVLKAGITRALMKKNLNLNSFLPSRVNWAIQSSGVDYLHLLCVSMNYLIKKYSLDARLSLSVHDEIRYLASKKDKYRVATALQISNLWTRAMFAESVGMYDLPQSCAFFSAVDIDHVLRKEVDMDCVTPSNPIAEAPGESLDVMALLNKGEIGELGEGKDLLLPADEEEVSPITPIEINENEHDYKYSYGNPAWRETSVKMQIATKKQDVQRFLRDYKKNYGRLDFKDVMSGELFDSPTPVEKKVSKSIAIALTTRMKKISSDGSINKTAESVPTSKNDKHSSFKKATNSTKRTRATKLKAEKSSTVDTPLMSTSSKSRKIESKKAMNKDSNYHNLNMIENLTLDEIANLRDTSKYTHRKDDDLWAGIITNEEDFINSLAPKKKQKQF